MYLYRPMQIVLIAVSAFLFSQIAASEAANGVEPTGVNTLQGQPRLTIGHNEIGVAVDVVKLNPDGTRILTVSENNVAKIWSTKSGDLLRTINLGHVFKQVDSNGLPCVPASDKDPWCTATIASANYSPDGKKLVTNAFWDPTARVWDVDTGKLLNSFAHGPDEEVSFSAFSPDGKQIVTASSDKTAKLWDAGSGSLIVTFHGHKDYVHSADISHDGKYVLTASRDGTAKLWDADTGKLLYTLPVSDQTWVTTAVFSPDSARLVTGSMDGHAMLWDSSTGNLLFDLDGHQGSVNDSIFSPNGNLVLTMSADKSAKLWDSKSGELLYTFNTDMDFNRAYELPCCNHLGAFSSDGKRVLTAPMGPTATMWDVKTGLPLMVFEANQRQSMKHLYGAAFGPDGKSVVTGYLDEIETVTIWNTLN